MKPVAGVRILHLYSDWKLTGPAAPTIELCRSLMDEGWDVLLACRRPPVDSAQSIAGRAEKTGVPVTTELHLNRYLPPGETWRDLRGIAAFVRARGVGLIHCHLTHDHVLGGWASWQNGRRVPVVRTNHKGVPLKAHLANRWLLSRWSDGVIEFSRRALEQDRRRFWIPWDRIVRVDPAVDAGRFHPQKARPELRGELGVGPGEVLVGIVARVQRHRRFDVLLRAMALLEKSDPAIRLMILGRGTYLHQVAREPAERLGLGDRVLFPGYREADYVDYLGAMDIKVFLVPGSDGTCRAVREAMIMGIPVICARRGMLPEMVEHGTSGLVIDDEPENLARAILDLARSPALRRRMGRAARQRALRDFSLERQARRVGLLYKRLLGFFADGRRWDPGP